MQTYLHLKSALIVGALAFGSVRAHADAGGHDVMHTAFDWGHMAVGSIMMIAFWALIIALVAMICLKIMRRHNRNSNHYGQSPLGVLRVRFPKREIDQSEYQSRKRTLEHDRTEGRAV